MDLGEVIILIFDSGASLYKKMVLVYSVLNPVEYHINCLGLSFSNDGVYSSCGS